MAVDGAPPALVTVKVLSFAPPTAVGPKSNNGPSDRVRLAGGNPEPMTFREAVCGPTPSLYKTFAVDVNGPAAIGAKVTITVHVAAGARLAAQVPPVPGKVPPLNVNGKLIPEPVVRLADTPPEFVTVMG